MCVYVSTVSVCISNMYMCQYMYMYVYVKQGKSQEKERSTYMICLDLWDCSMASMGDYKSLSAVYGEIYFLLWGCGLRPMGNHTIEENRFDHRQHSRTYSLP